jgi:hypothetical protein
MVQLPQYVQTALHETAVRLHQSLDRIKHSDRLIALLRRELVF